MAAFAMFAAAGTGNSINFRSCVTMNMMIVAIMAVLVSSLVGGGNRSGYR